MSIAMHPEDLPETASHREDDLQILPAEDLLEVAAWLKARGLPEAEIRRMYAAKTTYGSAVAFPYVGDGGRLDCVAYSVIGATTYRRWPAGTAAGIYGLLALRRADDVRVIVVGSELEAHWWWSLGFCDVVSVPEDFQPEATSEMVSPLSRFRQIVLAMHNTQAGEALAQRLAKALGPDRCYRIHVQEGAPREEMQTHLQLAASAAATRVAMAAMSDVARKYQVIGGRTCYIRTDRNGNEVVETLANFSAHVDEEIALDDGAELRREFRVSGSLASGEPLQTARVIANEFASLNWVTREWGIRAVVSAGNGTKDHLRTAIQHLSTPKRRRIFRHTGWVEYQGRDVFLFQGGAVGAEGLEVDLPPPLDRFVLPSEVSDLKRSVAASLQFLDCAPFEVTAPLLASVYLAPVAGILNPDLTVWLHGSSGSMKSTVSALAQCHFGDFDRKTLSATWTSTENALENRLFTLKDVLSVIDDYAPQADIRAQRELDRRVQRILRNVGNRAGRGRLTAELTQRAERPPRGFLLCNGEELPPGVSINARLVPVEIERSTLNVEVISKLQAQTHLLREAMRGYIEWLQPQMSSLRKSLSNRRDEVRSEMQKGSSAHLRQPEASANLYIGLDLALRFFESAGALAASEANDLRAQVREALQSLAGRHTEGLTQLHPAEVFVDVLSALYTQGKVRLLDAGDGLPLGSEIEMIGWRKGDVALVIPEAAYRRVAMFTREAGDHWAPSLQELHKALVSKGYAHATSDGRNAGQWRVGPAQKKKRGWLMPVALFGSHSGLQYASSRLQDDWPDESAEESPNPRQSLALFPQERSLPPMPPSGERKTFPSGDAR